MSSREIARLPEITAALGHAGRSRRLGRLMRTAAALGLAAGLSACFRPLYGPTASGTPLPAVLSAIEVGEVTTPPNYERFSHYLRSELVYNLNGSGLPADKRYRLALAFA